MQTYGVKYIGSKASLIEKIIKNIERNLGGVCTSMQVIDVFTGTTRVAQAFRSKGWSVQSSDLAWASVAYANAFLMRTEESGKRIPELLEQLQSKMDTAELSLSRDWITENYCDVSGTKGGIVRMWKPKNGLHADFIRNSIQTMLSTGEINEHESMILVACLMFALDKVDNSVGVQQAYLKEWAQRTDNDLNLIDLPFYTGPVGNHMCGNSLEILYESADLAYLDPPYSNHSYSTYYHIWDSITRWDKPEVGLNTNRRVDRVSKHNDFDESMVSVWNSKRTALDAFLTLCKRLPVKYLLISYNNESLVPLDQLLGGLEGEFGKENINVEEIAYQRNIMSQIGNATLYKEEFKTQNVEVLIWIAKKN
jgi:adenine-specific DNA-methyltransferase